MDVLDTILLGEAVVLPKFSPEDISVEEKDLLVVADEAVDLSLEGARERRLACAGEVIELVGGIGGD